MDLLNKVAIVTGASRGIGAGVVDKFAMHGAKVVIADISLGETEGFADKLKKNGHEVYASQTDVTRIESVESIPPNRSRGSKFPPPSESNESNN